MRIDKPLALLALLLVAVIVAFVMKLTPYPFGILVIIILMIARVAHLKSR